VAKPAGTFRLLIVGSSTSLGFPWGRRSTFGYRLRTMLEQALPGRTIEVIHAGQMNAASAEVRDTVKNGLRYRPDLVAVYSGQNVVLAAGRPRQDGRLRAALKRLRLARALGLIARHGVEPGDRVGIAARNSASWIVLYMGVLMAGGCVTLLNGWWSGEELARGIDLAGCRLVLADPQRADRASAVLALVGVINVPIIHYSVEWWTTLHQPASVTKLDKPSIQIAMLIPLFIMMAGFQLYFGWVLSRRLRGEILRRERNASWL
jgi:non-ribosomal peptide synthetase component F